MTRVTLEVSVDLDPVLGWGHDAEDFRKLVEKFLKDTVPHYNPCVFVRTGAEVGHRMQFPADYYWWHKSVLRELLRLESINEIGYSAAGIAANIQMGADDVLRYCMQLEEMGLVERAVPRWESRYPWFTLTESGRRLIGR